MKTARATRHPSLSRSRIADCGLRKDRQVTPREILFELFNRADDGVEVRPIAGIEFGMEKFSIGANLKCSAARRNESERLDTLAEFENFGRQTDGLGCVVSNHAVFD